MVRKYFIIICFIATGGWAHSQTTRPDSIPVTDDTGLAIDTSMDYEDLLSDLDLFLDSILAPRSYFLVNLSVAQGYFNFTNSTNTRIKVVQKTSLSPTIGYYSKSGLGLTLAGYMVNDSQHMNLYQLSFSPSYDYLKDRDFAAGIAYLRYFTKDSLSFYTSPLQNEVNGYFLLRKTWLQPGIAASYGWGSKTEYTKRRRFIDRLGIYVPVITTTEKSIIDFSVTTSVRHDFYWLNIFSKKDYMRLTPQLAFSSGTQKFGFNQTTGTYGVNGNNVLYNAGSVNLDNKLRFQPLSLTLYVRPEYSVGKFYIQPQFILDYYFPGKKNNLTTLFSINTGFAF
jgi:hypothetical protein